MPKAVPIIHTVVLLIVGLSISKPSHANMTPVSRSDIEGGVVLPVATTDVRVLRERLTVDITPIANRHAAPLVSVVAEYELRHDGKGPAQLEVGFPLAGQFEQSFGFRKDAKPVEGLGYEVMLDGKALDARAEALPLPRAARSANPWVRGMLAPDEGERARLMGALKRWVESDAKLAELLAEYSRIAPSWERSAAAQKALEEEVQPLLTRKHLAHYVALYLGDRDNMNWIPELIAEADPRMRKDVNGTHYVPTVSQWPPPDKATLEGYRKTIDAWLATRPAIAENYSAVAREHEAQRAARAFMEEKVKPVVRGKGLSDLAVARLVQYLEEAFNPNPRGYDPKKGWEPPATTLPTHAPDEWLVAQLDPEVERERQRRIAEADALLERYGFDTTFLSPLTARGYDRRVGWRDSSTWTALKFQAPPTMDEQSALGKHSFERGSYSTVVTGPRSEAKLIRFAVPLVPGQTRTLRVAYRALAEVDDLARGEGYASQIVHVRYILKTARNWKSFGPIDLTVTLPKEGLVVMEPAPSAQRDLKEGRMALDAKVENPASNLRIAWVPATNDGRSALFSTITPDDLPDLRTLERNVQHPQARRALAAMIGLADQPARTPQSPGSALRGVDNLLRAGFSVDQAIVIGAPGGGSGMRAYEIKGTRDMYREVRNLALSGFERQTIFNAPILRLSAEDRRIVATWAAKVPIRPPDVPVARMSRAYLALLGSPEPTAAQVGEFLESARANDDVRYTALKLIESFPDDPRCFAPLVMEVLDKPAPMSTIPDPMPHNIYVAALGAFAHGAAAPLEDALRIMDKSDDFLVARSHRIGQLYGVEMGAERMRAICERIVRSSKDAHPDGWILAVNKIDPTGAREAVAQWAKDGVLTTAEVKRIEEQRDRGH